MQSIAVKNWDIFCRVVDNFGDIGVCWRLARQLAAEHNQQVRLWVDDVDSLIRIWPQAQSLDQQLIAGVNVCRWHSEFALDVQAADVVIEAFACEIPAIYIDKMAELKQRGQAPVWINLDYLSAEGWVEDCHRMPSTHPSTGLRKTFFFPGFTPRTGGLLREQSLISARDNFHIAPWLNSMGVAPQSDALLVSLFAYENPAIGSLLSTWVNSSTPVHCLVPNGKILSSINRATEQALKVGDSYTLGNLHVQVIPFITQTEYDQLLWACDINFVRGEDSFVRAQWAGKPMVWHIYPQDEETHITKLTAFLDLYTRASQSHVEANLRQLWLAWNREEDMAAAWQELLTQRDKWQRHSRDWCNALCQQPDLAKQLVDFCTNQPG